jgi:hypothetical protein
MPPLRKYSSSLTVSIRQRVSNVNFDPSARVTWTVTIWRGRRPATFSIVMSSLPSRPSVLRSVAFGELQRQHAHADQVRAVDALEAFDDHGAHAEQGGALRRPVARRAGAIFLARDHDERRAVGRYFSAAS